MSTVKMINEESGVSADVHKDEVENYKTAGFKEVKKAPAKKAPVKKAD